MILGAIIAGLIVVVFAYVASALVTRTGLFRVNLPEECKRWNENHVMEWTLFLTGVLIYAAFKVVGFNLCL